MEISVLVINLCRSVKRMAEINRRLSTVELPYTRISAVDGSTLSQGQIDRHYSPTLNSKIYRRPLSLGEIGCYMSHKKCWQHIVDHNLDMCLILEDDAELDACLPDLFPLIEPYKQPWDIIKLCTPPKRKKIASSLRLSDKFKLCQYKKIPSRATGYLVSYEGAVKLLNTRDHFGRPLDDDLQFYWEYQGNVLGIEPSPIGNSESSLKSDIDAGDKRRNTKKLAANFKTPLLRLSYELNILRHSINRVGLADKKK
ncbi:MAG: glycosyltransferase family 25 protein [Porticoccaceae bacterium]|nr:glycosyltransferase family 25 protein [Porticoccaceae bacterium]